MPKKLTQKILKELIRYNQKTGVFIWKVRDRKWFILDRSWKRFNNNLVNKEAGYIDKCVYGGNDYIRIGIFGKDYAAHRLAWLFVKGRFPKNDIDHKNGNGLDNRFSNIIDSTRKENCKNKKIQSNNKTGIMGVFYRETDNKSWIATYRKNGKNKSKGFYTKIEAIEFRIKFQKENGYSKRHGNKR